MGNSVPYESYNYSCPKMASQEWELWFNKMCGFVFSPYFRYTSPKILGFFLVIKVLLCSNKMLSEDRRWLLVASEWVLLTWKTKEILEVDTLGSLLTHSPNSREEQRAKLELTSNSQWSNQSRLHDKSSVKAPKGLEDVWTAYSAEVPGRCNSWSKCGNSPQSMHFSHLNVHLYLL